MSNIASIAGDLEPTGATPQLLPAPFIPHEHRGEHLGEPRRAALVVPRLALVNWPAAFH